MTSFGATTPITSRALNTAFLQLEAQMGGASVTVSDTPPTTPAPEAGDQWFESDTGRQLVYYDGAWIEIGSTATTNVNANDLSGTTLASNVVSSSLTSVGTLGSLTVTGDVTVDTNTLKVDSTNNRVGIANASPAYTLDVNGTIEGTQFLQGTDYLSPYQGFRNAIINGDFRINQRAFTSTTTNQTYGLDRWVIGYNSGTVTYSSQTFTVGLPAETGYESPTFARVVSASQTGAGHYAIFNQKIEDVRTLANSTVTISFWAKAGSGTPKVGVEIEQYFGSGGSPSANVTTAFGAVTLSTSWARYSVTATIPNINGKTIGTTANTSFCLASLWVSSGSSYDSRSSNIGTQNNTFDFWGVQVERGSVATPFEQRPIQAELALCQRYYYTSGIVYSQYLANNSNQFGEGFSFQYPVTMRTTPTLTNSFTSVDNAVLSASAATDKSVYIRETCASATFPYSNFSYSFVVSAEF
jgi:hypothetical protein